MTAYGAGLLALRNLGGALPADAVARGEVTAPGATDPYDDLYALYGDVERALAPLTAHIAALGKSPA